MATTCRESEIARRLLDAQAALVEAERGPINTDRLNQARRREARAAKAAVMSKNPVAAAPVRAERRHRTVTLP
jgi:hypothetical protein